MAAIMTTPITTTHLNALHTVGYYGRIDAKRRERTTKVHVHRKGHGPICGTTLHPDMRYQWCSHTTLSYIECQRCLAMVHKEMANG